jgi:hypothetical protein
MNQTKQQEQAAAAEQPRARRDWEWFWRIVAGLMLVFSAWAGWVVYQITPRSVVTPLAYATPVKPIGTSQTPGGEQAPAAPAAAAMQPPSLPIETGQASAVDQTAKQSAAPQALPSGQAGNQEKKEESIKGGGLRLATELSTPLPGKQDNLTTQEGSRVPAGPGADGKVRP